MDKKDSSDTKNISNFARNILQMYQALVVLTEFLRTTKPTHSLTRLQKFSEKVLMKTYCSTQPDPLSKKDGGLQGFSDHQRAVEILG